MNAGANYRWRTLDLSGIKFGIRLTGQKWFCSREKREV